MSDTLPLELKASDLRNWFKMVDRLKVLTASFNDPEATGTLDAQIDRMNLMYKTLTGDNSPEVNKGAL